MRLVSGRFISVLESHRTRDRVRWNSQRYVQIGCWKRTRVAENETQISGTVRVGGAGELPAPAPLAQALASIDAAKTALRAQSGAPSAHHHHHIIIIIIIIIERERERERERLSVRCRRRALCARERRRERGARDDHRAAPRRLAGRARAPSRGPIFANTVVVARRLRRVSRRRPFPPPGRRFPATGRESRAG